MKFPAFVFTAFLLGEASGWAAAPATTPWKLGLSTIKITPQQPVIMYGYGGRNDPHQGVASDLYAKAMALEAPAGERAVLVTCDLGGVHGDMIERIATRLGEKFHLPRQAILYNASHTHAGPWAWVADDEAKGMSAAAVQSTREYVADLERKLQQVAEQAL